MKSALIIYPHQLFEAKCLPQAETVFMVEDPLYFGTDQQFPLNLHKQKIILHRASMRRYVKEVLWPAGYNVEYLEYSQLVSSADIFDHLKHFDHVYAFDPVDDTITRRLQAERREREKAPSLEFLASPNFYLKYEEVKQFFADNKGHDFNVFYQWQRERFNVLIGPDYKPLGGKWRFDEQKRAKLPAGQALPSFQAYGDNEFVAEATVLAEKFFPGNPGSTDFIWPTNHAEAKGWLDDFVEHRLDHYGTYWNAIDSQGVWLYHSALAGSINTGLLTPQQVITAALQRHARKPVDLPNLESFIQQILGWREYMRGIYTTTSDTLKTSNMFKQQRHLTEDWHNGTLGLPPFDDLCARVNQHAYAHSNECHFVAGNLMLMCEINPDDVYKWSMSNFIDAYDWISTPNVYGISQNAGGTSIVPGPTLYNSDELIAVSNYEKGDWADTWDGLYWRFIEKHRDVLSKHTHTNQLVIALDALNPDRKRVINYRAEDFLARYTRIS